MRGGPTREPGKVLALAEHRDYGRLRYPHDLAGGADAFRPIAGKRRGQYNIGKKVPATKFGQFRKEAYLN
jgi:hypothetical protein